MATDATRRARPARTETELPPRDRPRLLLFWYRIVQSVARVLFSIQGGLRASGCANIPPSGGAILVSNHLSHLDVFVMGIPLARPLNYVARSSLFFPPLGILIRSVGGFPIQREGMGAQGLKETLKRLRSGGVVVLFPEGTRSRDGELGELKSGIAVLASRAAVPIIPAAIAGTFEAWPRNQKLPGGHPIWIHYGPTIQPADLDGLSAEDVTSLIRTRILASQAEARRSLRTMIEPAWEDPDPDCG
jgi:1-acyl-sn-glycerol-3-phosphate acyltransferase